MGRGTKQDKTKEMTAENTNQTKTSRKQEKKPIKPKNKQQHLKTKRRIYAESVGRIIT